MPAHAFEHQTHGLEMNGGDHLQGHQGIAQQHFGQGRIAQGPAFPGKAGIQDGRAGFFFMNDNGDMLAGRMDAERIAAVVGQEGRNIKCLWTAMPNEVRISSHGQHIAMPLIIGVVDLVDDRF